MKIAILGANGHISKCAFWVYSQNPDNEFYLFSRSKAKTESTYSIYPDVKKICFEGYADFNSYEYDVIVNGVGSWDSLDQDSKIIFKTTETYDDLIINYQLSHPDTVSIHISSGAAYTNDYQEPVTKDTKSILNINHIAECDLYSIAKINSEAKHRAYSELNIVDIRLFGFFSRFMSLEYHYLLSALINSVKNGTVFKAVNGEFWRDYIHIEDFALLMNGIGSSSGINTAIDVRSKQPISKSELIRLFVDKYNLKVEYNTEVTISKTGLKPYYYSNQPNDIYTPHYTSLEAVENELKYFMR